MSKTTTAANAILNYHVRGTTPSALTPYIGLLTAVGTPAEVTYTSYARVAMTTTNFSSVAASNSIANTVAIAFPQAGSAGSGEVIGFGVYDASSAGNLIRKSYLASGVYRLFTAAASTDNLTIPSHAFANNDRVVLIAQDGVSLPTGLSADTLYYVVNQSSGIIQLSATQGGAAINITADGAGIIVKVNPQTISNGSTPSFAIGAVTFKEF